VANSSVPITPGAGASIDAHQISSGDQQQIVRQATSDTVDTAPATAWTVSTTASTSQIAANENRVAMLIYNASNVRVYLRFDGTAPLIAGTNAHWYLDSGDRFEVPFGLCQLAVSVIAASAGAGTLNFTLGTET
jgi:hypothetical protein